MHQSTRKVHIVRGTGDHTSSQLEMGSTAGQAHHPGTGPDEGAVTKTPQTVVGRLGTSSLRLIIY